MAFGRTERCSCHNRNNMQRNIRAFSSRSDATAATTSTVATSASPITPRRWWALLICATIAGAGVYLLAVQTAVGQAFENTALRGADQVGASAMDQANIALGHITVWSLGIATLVVGAIGLLRRQPALALAAVAVIVGGQVVTQSLKRYILPRPELVPVSGSFTENSFPSGHTTIAMTVMVAIFLVVPYRVRGLAMMLTMGWAAGIGAYTITAKWHRLSDTVGADLVALALGCAAAVVLHHLGKLKRVEDRPKARLVVVVVMTLLTISALVLGTILASAAATYSLHDPVIEWDVYLSAHAFSLSASWGVALIFWWSWRGIEVG
ncbi:phosphatase PAP2 family protein [Leucobacter rhizosphaerae]|uniref:Phosphatase PAP2 family protein n=1 Tax=Leucobacter rhizosphaerae TaxID=2932245 RepID=A0ABY4FVU8_9MICO|nr:phosphatase PAP2 family protein [Leucobacter rhizosphaerae]UOQ60254.1 phosphatase PAP2 family protein [Leucobacter rhizosphaerae]